MKRQAVKVKAEARLDLLRQAGIAVETWLKSAMNQVMEELENERWNNLSTHDPSLSVRPTEHTCVDSWKVEQVLWNIAVHVDEVTSGLLL